ncbi:MAG: hypothetical protein Q4E34_04695, partial [Synergistaceae bacterium]|nr:hypothetical protein [Synergistaceae bacterium]
FLSLITLVVALLAKSKYWYNNPVLTLEGYKMFWFATKKQGEKRFGISRKEINIGDVITHTNICDSKILYVWRNK